MADKQKVYPRGSIAMGNGVLMTVTNVSVDLNNNAKQVHTLRSEADGIFFGPQETTISFNFVVNEEGLERDFIGMLQKKQVKQLRIKVPGKTITTNGAVRSVRIEFAVDNEIGGTVEFIGKTEET
ncbi:hypothetical protein [Sorangium sp. So ce1389]|uniref:hypothetical protein n=1 Tax=Sorangium sp. So ce1389 TaxID=3133336 RepID=UPI003F6213C9